MHRERTADYRGSAAVATPLLPRLSVAAAEVVAGQSTRMGPCWEVGV